MKLRNKKTGEIGKLYSVCEDDEVWLKVEIEHDKEFYNTHTIQEVENFDVEYNSLAELNEEWEDYEEPEPHFVSEFGDVYSIQGIAFDRKHIERLKEIGNYFETKEEAEKAVEKLKAWKRLKDKGFRFKKWHGTPSGWSDGEISFTFNGWNFSEVGEDLELLFGGEE